MMERIMGAADYWRHVRTTETVDWAWKQKAPSPEAKLVLLAISDRVAWNKIAEVAGITNAELDNAVYELRAEGLVHPKLVLPMYGTQITLEDA